MSKNDTSSEPYGSLAYSAPEIVGQVQYGYEPDVWSIGMIIYYLINTKDPFSEMAIGVSGIQKMIVEGDVKAIVGYMKKDILSKIMEMCLIKKNRPSIEDIISKVNQMIDVN